MNVGNRKVSLQVAAATGGKSPRGAAAIDPTAIHPGETETPTLCIALEWHWQWGDAAVGTTSKCFWALCFLSEPSFQQLAMVSSARSSTLLVIQHQLQFEHPSEGWPKQWWVSRHLAASFVHLFFVE